MLSCLSLPVVLQVSFLAGLPAMKGLNLHYLRQLSHCFHQVTAT